MADTPDVRSPAQQPVPKMQAFLDSIFPLLILGLTVPTVIYIAWGLISMHSTPMFPR